MRWQGELSEPPKWVDIDCNGHLPVLTWKYLNADADDYTTRKRGGRMPGRVRQSQNIQGDVLDRFSPTFPTRINPDTCQYQF